MLSINTKHFTYKKYTFSNGLINYKENNYKTFCMCSIEGSDNYIVHKDKRYILDDNCTELLIDRDYIMFPLKYKFTPDELFQYSLIFPDLEEIFNMLNDIRRYDLYCYINTSSLVDGSIDVKELINVLLKA